jgi:hypothetical protein
MVAKHAGPGDAPNLRERPQLDDLHFPISGMIARIRRVECDCIRLCVRMLVCAVAADVPAQRYEKDREFPGVNEEPTPLFPR